MIVMKLVCTVILEIFNKYVNFELDLTFKYVFSNALMTGTLYLYNLSSVSEFSMKCVLSNLLHVFETHS